MLDLALEQLPHLSRVAVCGQHGGAVKLLQHDGQRWDPERRIRDDPIAHPAWELDLLQEVLLRTGEEGDRGRLPALPLPQVLDLVKFLADREPRVPTQAFETTGRSPGSNSRIR